MIIKILLKNHYIANYIYIYIINTNTILDLKGTVTQSKIIKKINCIYFVFHNINK